MPQHGGKREGSGRTPLPESEKKIAKTIYITPTLQSDIDQFATGNTFRYECMQKPSSAYAYLLMNARFSAYHSVSHCILHTPSV